MALPSRKKMKECDDLARGLSVTPKFDDDGQIIPIGAPESKGRVYVIFMGRAVGLFYNWYAFLSIVRIVALTHYKGPREIYGQWIQRVRVQKIFEPCSGSCGVEPRPNQHV